MRMFQESNGNQWALVLDQGDEVMLVQTEPAYNMPPSDAQESYCMGDTETGDFPEGWLVTPVLWVPVDDDGQLEGFKEIPHGD